MRQEILRRAAAVRLALFDVDGVLTDGGLVLGTDGAEFKTFHVHDGLGLLMLLESGLEVGVISARASAVVAERMQALGIRHVVLGVGNKAVELQRLLAQLGLAADQAAFVGDDLVDLAPMALAGLSVAVADGHPLVRARAHWVTQCRGGRGAVREVCELLLRAQGRLDVAYQRYLPS
jgi:3-deoxy-D-manno-octulosonate 8-phosphate phosphatase (KDO 8-P phosphatase)